jgi:hypothetical protein
MTSCRPLREAERHLDLAPDLRLDLLEADADAGDRLGVHAVRLAEIACPFQRAKRLSFCSM